jgi:hypothetical protein
MSQIWIGYHPDNYDSQRRWEFESRPLYTSNTKYEIMGIFCCSGYLWIPRIYFSD